MPPSNVQGIAQSARGGAAGLGSKSRQLHLALTLLIATFAAELTAGTRLVPVMNGPIDDARYRTTIELRAATSDQCRVEVHGADGATFDVDAAHPAVATFSAAVPVSSAARVTCAGDVAVASRIQKSSDGGATYSRGRIFSQAEEVVDGQTRVLSVDGALTIAETSGRTAHVRAAYRASRIRGIADRQYDLGPHEQRLIEFSADVGSVEATISPSGEGKIALSTQAPAPPAALPDIVGSPFKAAPFHDEATGLIYMRERWYDPRTGTFLTPDPRGYRDSSNLYAYCAGDPVNCSDPTGTTGESDLAEERRAIAARRQAEISARHAAEVRAADAAEQALNDALHRFGTARMIELRNTYGIHLTAKSIVAILPDRLTAITASGQVIPNPYAGRLEDQTADLVLSATSLQVAAPLIATAFRTGGLRAGTAAIADEAIGQIVGVNPSAPIALTRSITNALEAQRALATLARQVSAKLASDLTLARTVLSRAEYQAAVTSERIAAAQYGNAVERLVAKTIRDDPELASVFRRVGGPSNPDFTAFGRNFDITSETRAAVMKHMKRPRYGEELIVVTYERPANFMTFPGDQ